MENPGTFIRVPPHLERHVDMIMDVAELPPPTLIKTRAVGVVDEPGDLITP